MSVDQLSYTEENIRSLDWKEHIRLRPGMYIGKLGDGSSPDDGVYVLLKEVIDNAIDEHTMGFGKHIEVNIQDKTVTVRDYGRGIPLGKVVDVVSKMNTGAKYDSKAFQKSVGLNGVGTKAVNALSNYFKHLETEKKKQQSSNAANCLKNTKRLLPKKAMAPLCILLPIIPFLRIIVLCRSTSITNSGIIVT